MGWMKNSFVLMLGKNIRRQYLEKIATSVMETLNNN